MNPDVDPEELDLAAMTWTLPPGDGALKLVVLGDSTCFFDHTGPRLPDDPSLYPNVAAALVAEELGRPVTTTLIARAGTTVRDLHKVVTKDRHVMFDVLLGADLVVVGFGGFDHAPGGVPPAVDAVVPFLRPASLRRRTRKVLHAAYPWLVRATGHRLTRTHAGDFDRLYDDLLLHVRGLTRGAPGVALGPTSHHGAYYAWKHPRHATREAEQLAIAARHGYATEPVWEHVLPHRDDLNPDGIHWPTPVHAEVGRRVAGAFLRQLRGEVDIPGIPGT